LQRVESQCVDQQTDPFVRDVVPVQQQLSPVGVLPHSARNHPTEVVVNLFAPQPHANEVWSIVAHSFAEAVYLFLFQGRVTFPDVDP
jgi:hypothetical protein